MGRVSRFHKFSDILIEAARDEGFPLAGALDLDRAAIDPHVQRFDEWLTQGYDGAMTYLKRGRDRRADPRALLPSAKSILCVASPYSARPAGNPEPSKGPRYARYLNRNDYHEDISCRLERVMKRVSAEWGRPFEWKVCVDTSAVLERSWAALAGLGWIGKNTMLIHPQYGSYLFLGEVLISEPTGEGPKPLPNYCGNCVRCLEACPTQALPRPGVLDSNRCIAYWTLEKRGALPIDESQKKAMGTWIAGCDLCQEACPFNAKASKNVLEHESDETATQKQGWRELLEETFERYQERVRDSALSRVKPAQFSRNLAIALANAVREFPGLASELGPLIQKRGDEERDPDARPEWERLVREAQAVDRD